MTWTNIFRVDVPQDKWCREAFVQTSWPTAHWRRLCAQGASITVFAQQVWGVGRPRKGAYLCGGWWEKTTGNIRENLKLGENIAHLEDFAITERAGVCINISVHLPVCRSVVTFLPRGWTWFFQGIASKFRSSLQTLLLSTRLVYPIVCLTSPLGILNGSQTHFVPKELGASLPNLFPP